MAWLTKSGGSTLIGPAGEGEGASEDASGIQSYCSETKHWNYDKIGEWNEFMDSRVQRYIDEFHTLNRCDMYVEWSGNFFLNASWAQAEVRSVIAEHMCH